MTTVTVTGASGFLGKNLVAQLIKEGYLVRALSRHKMKYFEYVESYLDSPVSKILIHLAENPDRGFVNKENYRYSENAIELVKSLCTKGYEKIIYASSGAIYGNSSITPYEVSEDVSATDVYSQTKIECEKVVLDAGGLVVRFSNLYGKGMSPNNVVSDILKQIPDIEPLCIRDETPVCDFLWVEDAAAAIVAACSKYKPSKVINVASGVGVSIRTLIKLALELSSQPDREIKSIASSTNTSTNILSISDTEKLIGWRPMTSLRDGIQQLLENTVNS